MITLECRNESFKKLNPSKRQQLILSVLGDKEMTARQIADKVGATDLNYIKPRLTELLHLKVITAVRKECDPISSRTVSVYKRV